MPFLPAICIVPANVPNMSFQIGESSVAGCTASDEMPAERLCNIPTIANWRDKSAGSVSTERCRDLGAHSGGADVPQPKCAVIRHGADAVWLEHILGDAVIDGALALALLAKASELRGAEWRVREAGAALEH